MIKLFASCIAIALSGAAAAQNVGLPAVGQSVAAFEMEYVKRSTEDIQKRTHLLAEWFTGRPLRAAEGMTTVARAIDASWHAPFAEAPSVLVRYLPRHDEIRLLDDEIARKIDLDKGGLSQDEALRYAAKYLQQLTDMGFLDARHYDLKRAEIGYHRVAGGSTQSKTPEFERITEFRITLRPAINGIELANAGLRLGIHVSGRLTDLRLGGVTVRSVAQGTVEAPAAGGRQEVRMVDDREIDKRFSDSIVRGAKRKLHWTRLMYVMPEDTTHAVVAPTRVFAFSDLHTGDDEPVVGRRKIVGYSITDAAAAMIDYTPAARATEVREPVRVR